MTEERIFRLETDVAELREQNAALAVSVRHLTESVDSLTVVLNEMKSTMDKGRGALWVIVAASTFLGGIISAVVNRLTSQ